MTTATPDYGTYIEYRYEDGSVAARQTSLENTKWARENRLVELAQRSMAGKAYASAHIFTDNTETVVSKATEWQKRNG